jgi:hypothetical protein
MGRPPVVTICRKAFLAETTMRFYWFAMVFVGSVWLFANTPALAQPEDPQVRFNRAVDLATAGNYVEAVEICLAVLPKLPASKQSRVHKLLGYSYRKLDMLPEAWNHMAIYVKGTAKEDSAASQLLRGVEATLKRSYVMVKFSCHPDGLTLNLPSSKLSTASHYRYSVSNSTFSWWFIPGSYEVNAEAQGHEPGTVTIDVKKEGDTGTREIRLVAIAAEKVPVVATGASNADGTMMVSTPVASETPSRILEWTLIGSGVTLGLTGGMFNGLGYSKNEDLHSRYGDSSKYPDSDQAKALYDEAKAEEVRPMEIAAYAFYGIGGAAIVAGIVSWAVRDPEAKGGSTAFTISPFATPGGAAALMTFGF